MVISADGGTAAWGNCIYAQIAGMWAVQAEVPGTQQGPVGISTDGNTLLLQTGVYVRSGETWSEQAFPEGGDSFKALSADGNTLITDQGPFPPGEDTVLRLGAFRGNVEHAGRTSSTPRSKDGNVKRNSAKRLRCQPTGTR